MNEFIFLEKFGRLFDISTILEDELEGGVCGRWTSLDRMDRYFYETIWGLL
jgi:hypothetical protein